MKEGWESLKYQEKNKVAYYGLDSSSTELNLCFMY